MRSYLDFEKPVGELEQKIEELRAMQASGDVSVAEEIVRLEAKAALTLKELYDNLTPWQKTQVARWPTRPHCLDYVAQLVTEFTPFAGDRKAFSDIAQQLSARLKNSARAEKAGAIYIDVWEGFVDEGGKFTNFGPDYEGQMRRLRSSDGVFFTKNGARKLAHYVERELRRYMSNRVPVALPSGPVGPLPAEPKSTVRPVAGPVVPLTVTPGNSEELLGGAGSQPMHSDAAAARVLVKGEPVPAPPGRADDFVWPQGGDRKSVPPVASAPAAPASDVAPAASPVARTEPPAAAGKVLEEPTRGAAGTSPQNTPARSKAENRPRPQPQRDVPRPPAPIQRSGGPFGWLR